MRRDNPSRAWRWLFCAFSAASPALARYRERSPKPVFRVIALDNPALAKTPIPAGKLPAFTLSGFVAAAAALFTLATMAAHGFDENGLRLGSLIAWRFAFVVFFAALMAGPLCRLAPFGLGRFLTAHLTQSTWSFCAAFGVYLASLILPNAFGPPGLDDPGLDKGMVVFAGLSGSVAAVLAYAASEAAARKLGPKQAHAILVMGLAFFWLTYALTALSHLYGPHRPEMFSGVSLSLMLVALLACFADNFLRKYKGVV